MSTRFTPPLPDDPSPRMSTKVIFTRNSPLRTVLVDETTGRELYRINTPRKFVGSVTRVFRCEPAAPPVPNLVPPLHWDANDPSEDDSDGNESDNNRVDGAVDEAPGEDLPFVENEIARLYWKWFASPRIVFDGKIRRRTEFMPLKGRYKKSYTFSHNGASYRWSLAPYQRPRWRLVIDDTSETLIAQFYLASPFKKGRSYFEVTPAGMAMLDHIVVTFIPVELRRRED